MEEEGGGGMNSEHFVQTLPKKKKAVPLHVKETHCNKSLESFLPSQYKNKEKNQQNFQPNH